MVENCFGTGTNDGHNSYYNQPKDSRSPAFGWSCWPAFGWYILFTTSQYNVVLILKIRKIQRKKLY